MNVLITSAAAKVLLVKAFKEAARPLGGRVFTSDVESVCAAGAFADGHFATDHIDHPGAEDELSALCRTHDIDLVVPTRDGELGFLAQCSARLAAAGTRVLVCGEDSLADVQDKRRFSERVSRAGLRAVPQHDPASIPMFPVFIRPVIGAGGRGACRIDRPQDLPANVERYLVHPLVLAKEYSIDLLMDFDSRPLQAVARERRLIVGGESKISTVVEHDALEAASMKLGETLGLVGHNVVQAFDDPERGLLFIEVNPRFGGASNCSIQAGLASPERIIALMAGDDSAREPRWIRRGISMLRYSDDVFVDAVGRPA